jgi:hypothetical protein
VRIVVDKMAIGFKVLNRSKVGDDVGNVDRPQPFPAIVMDDASIFEGNITKISSVPVPGIIRKLSAVMQYSEHEHIVGNSGKFLPAF